MAYVNAACTVCVTIFSMGGKFEWLWRYMQKEMENTHSYPPSQSPDSPELHACFLGGGISFKTTLPPRCLCIFMNSCACSSSSDAIFLKKLANPFSATTSRSK